MRKEPSLTQPSGGFFTPVATELKGRQLLMAMVFLRGAIIDERRKARTCILAVFSIAKIHAVEDRVSLALGLI
jgi:hypothetical protein